ncbi:MAG: hypothetical protein M3Z05_10920 [Gemmatimonadota bacterium]|nr:hypothetical protein [Gemmatimonadota bacterium]
MNDRGAASNLGIHVYGFAAVALGVNQLTWGDFAFIWHPVQSGVPFRTALVYIVALCLIAAGVAVQRRSTARIGLAVLTVLYVLAACLWLPRVIGYPQIFGTWGGFNEQFILGVAGAIGYVSFASTSPMRDARLIRREFVILRTTFGVCVVILGCVHFSALPQTAAMVPAWIPPSQRFWAAATGAAMILAGVSIIIGVQSPLSTRLFAALIGVFAVFVWLPRIYAEPLGHVAWAGTMITVAIAGGGWMVADVMTPKGRGA